LAEETCQAGRNPPRQAAAQRLRPGSGPAGAAGPGRLSFSAGESIFGVGRADLPLGLLPVGVITAVGTAVALPQLVGTLPDLRLQVGALGAAGRALAGGGLQLAGLAGGPARGGLGARLRAGRGPARAGLGGGRARLSLTDQEDPFAAGLELAASPPGKKLQSVSLLSGGEKALTALALIFAVFLTKPAPLCVLDEVDAPLDDANVERLMALLEELAEGTRTRFLVVTHHPLTMSRMHRLYGVTMAERGISQLVSVDLTSAVELRATA
jgi:hypothetical protein